MKTRFAPSPTGWMHLGNVRTALFNFLYAKHHHGTFLLRVEDTDVERSEDAYRAALLTDLTWLGIQWDEGPMYQLERQDIYNQYYERMQAAGQIYPCFCTEEQLALTRKVQLAAHQPPRYPGTCRHLTEQARRDKIEQGVSYTLRLAIPHGEKILFTDLIRGPQSFESDHIGDFIVRRADKTSSFMFCNAIDDALMGVTHALRGDDHLTNTPRQLLILRSLGLSEPHYGHFPTILGPDGKPLSKRNGSRSIQDLQQEGYLASGINNYLARLGHYDPSPKYSSMAELAEQFDLNRISHSPAHYDEHQLKYWQKAAMHQSDWHICWEHIKQYLGQDLEADKQKAFVELVQPNLEIAQDVVVFKPILSDKSFDFTETELQVLRSVQPSFWQICIKHFESNAQPKVADLISTLQSDLNIKGKAVFLPIRLALSQMSHGPELEKISQFLGAKEVVKRFQRVVEALS